MAVTASMECPRWCQMRDCADHPGLTNHLGTEEEIPLALVKPREIEGSDQWSVPVWERPRIELSLFQRHGAPLAIIEWTIQGIGGRPFAMTWSETRELHDALGTMLNDLEKAAEDRIRRRQEASEAVEEAS